MINLIIILIGIILGNLIGELGYFFFKDLRNKKKYK